MKCLKMLTVHNGMLAHDGMGEDAAGKDVRVGVAASFDSLLCHSTRPGTSKGQYGLLFI